MSQSYAPSLLSPTLLQSVQKENARLQKFLTAQRVVMTTLEQRAGRSLTAMGVHLQQLAGASADSEAWQVGWEAMQQEIHSLRDLLADTLLLQKLEAGKVEVKLESLDLRDMLLAITRPWVMAQGPARLVCNLEATLPVASADRELTEATLMDLVSRGLKYADLDAPVVLDVGCWDNQVVIRITTQRFAPAGDRSLATEIVLCCRRIEVQGGTISCEHYPEGLQTVVIRLPIAGV